MAYRPIEELSGMQLFRLQGALTTLKQLGYIEAQQLDLLHDIQSNLPNVKEKILTFKEASLESYNKAVDLLACAKKRAEYIIATEQSKQGEVYIISLTQLAKDYNLAIKQVTKAARRLDYFPYKDTNKKYFKDAYHVIMKA